MSAQAATREEEIGLPWPEAAHLRGVWRAQADLKSSNWFRVGGAAEFLFKPEDEAALAAFLQEKPAHIPHYIVGVGSNLLVRDGGVEGVVIRLGRGFAGIEVDGANGQIIAGGGALDGHVAAVAHTAGLGRLEFLSGIPGTIGGAVRMNAGAYGNDMQHVLSRAQVVMPDGTMSMMTAAELGYSYRHSALPAGAVVTKAWLNATADDPATIAQRMEHIAAARAQTQPSSRTGGSTFKNPEGAKAWELIDAAGCRGLMVGAAQMSPLHCNFMINTGNATAADLENLGEDVRARVQRHSGVMLEWEIERVGRK